MPVVPAKRDESPDMPALERITITSDRASNSNDPVKTEPTPTPTPTTEEASNNANVQAKKKTTDNNNNHTNSKKVTSSSSSKVIDILDLTKPSSTTVQRINALMNNQLKYIEAESKYHDELHKLQSKYSRVYADIFKRRKQIVSGECEPNLDECKWPPKINDESKKSKDDEKHSKQDKSEKSSKSTEDEKQSSSSLSSENEENKRPSPLPSKPAKNGKGKIDDEDEEKGVPNFWLEVMQSSRSVSSIIFDHDEPVLEYLKDIRVRMDAEKPAASYTLEFEFAENPFFRNRVLMKTFEFSNELDRKQPFKYHGPDLVRSIGTKIDWKPKKNVTVKLSKKKIKSRNRKAPPKIITKEQQQGSFFRFFESHEMHDKELEKKRKEGKEMGAESKSKEVALRDKKKSETVSSNESAGSEEEEEDDSDESCSHDHNDIRRFLTDTMLLMHEFTVAERLRGKLIPKAVLYMTGELEESDDDDEDDDEDDDDEDDFYVDDDSEDDDDENDNDDEEDDDDDEDDDDNDHRGKAWSKQSTTRVYKNGGGGGGSGGGVGGGSRGGFGGGGGRIAFGPDDCKQS